MVSSIRVILVLVLIFLSFDQEAQPRSSSPPIDLKPYLLRQEGQEAAPEGFQLGFVGEAGHRLQFWFGGPEVVELEVSLGFPEGGARTLRRVLEPGPRDTPVSFDLGPLLGNGPYRPLPAESRKGPQPKNWRPLLTGWWLDTHDTGSYLLTIKGRRVKDGEVLFLVDLRLPVQTWLGSNLDRLAYIDDDEAELELWLEKGAPVPELPVEVDLVEAKTGRSRSSLSHRTLTSNKTRVPFDLSGLEAATYHVRVRPRIDGRLWDDGVRRALYLYRNGPPPEADPPIEIPVAPQLFVDDYLIEDQIHLERVFHPARKLSNQPLLRPDRPLGGFCRLRAFEFFRRFQRGGATLRAGVHQPEFQTACWPSPPMGRIGPSPTWAWWTLRAPGRTTSWRRCLLQGAFWKTAESSGDYGTIEPGGPPIFGQLPWSTGPRVETCTFNWGSI